MDYELFNYLKSRKSVAIFVHINPDWDCMGSAFALRHALRNNGVKSGVFTNAPLSHHLNFMETDVCVYEEGNTPPDYECYCAVDVGAADRLGAWADAFVNKEDTVCIDHHIKQDGFAKKALVESGRSATGELVFEILNASNEKITKEIAQYLYCAISSDTGSFQYASVNKRTFEIVTFLLQTGIDASYLCSMLYERNTLKQLKLQAEAIESIKLYANGKIATASITREILEKYDAEKSDTEGLSQIPRKIDGVMISAFLTELNDGNVRVSLRALGDYNIEPVAKKFGGGGHKKAAGCTFINMNADCAEKLLVDELVKL